MTCAGIVEFTTGVSPHKYKLSDYPGSGKRFGVHFNYVVQDEQKGVADALPAGESSLKRLTGFRFMRGLLWT